MKEQKFPDKGFVGVKFRSSRGGSGHLVCLVSVWSGVHCGQRCQGGSVCLLYYESDQIRTDGSVRLWHGVWSAGMIITAP